MVVIILERVPVGLRGELSRWMLEPKAGVFVGRVSAMVRERLWEKVEKSKRIGAAMLIHTSDNEQGFAMRMTGNTSRLIEDFDGLSLVRIP